VETRFIATTQELPVIWEHTVLRHGWTRLGSATARKTPRPTRFTYPGRKKHWVDLVGWL